MEKQGKQFATTAAKSLYNGPYKFEGWQGTNNQFKLVKNEHYWDTKNVKTPEIDFQVIQKPEVAVQMYKTGKLDAALVNTPQLAQANKNNKAIALRYTTTLVTL